MEEIQREVRRKREAGLYPPEITAELEVESAEQEDDRLAGALRDLRRRSAFSADVTTASRKRLVAPVVSRVKRGIRAAIRWYINGLLEQLTAFAASAVRLLGLVVERLVSAEGRLASVEEGLRGTEGRWQAEAQELSRRITQAQEAAAEMDRRREALQERMVRVERSVRALRERLGVPTPAGPGAGARSWVAERALDYLEFENRFRGSREEILARQRRYVELFRGAPGPVLDLGCGRGEFLELLREAGIEAYGVDRYPDMVAVCRERGLHVVEEDALRHLEQLSEGCVGGIFCAQMIEHLDPPDVVHFFDLAARALRQGSIMVVETINPQSLFVFASAFYVDLGHLRPLHPLTLTFLAECAGFREVSVEYYSPPAPEFRPQPLEPVGRQELDDVISRINENFKRIDSILFGAQDYAVIARR